MDISNDWPLVADNGVKAAGWAISSKEPALAPPAIRSMRAGIWRMPGTMLRSLLLASGLVLAYAARGDGEKLTSLTLGSEVYTEVTVSSVTATDIYFSHSRGLGNAKLKTLDPELQRQFHFDPAAAADREKQQAEADARYALALKTKAAQTPKPAAGDGTQGQAGASDEVAQHEISAKSFLNRAAPTIEAEKWLTERPDLKGKFLLLDFWATWCGPCRRSIPELNALYSRFKDRLVVIGLSSETEQAVRKMTEPRIEYPVAIDTRQRASIAFGVERIPHAVLIDPNGIVRFEGHPGHLNERNLDKLLARFAQ
jgi:cytochrome c biogenesis protein CcmG, thiol:disulfide interchange protein DsbE